MPEKIRVIFVDDDRYQLEFAKLFLEPGDDMLIEYSSSPHDALEEIRRNRFDIVVTDYRMSGMDGIELVRAIRQTSKVPIIVYSVWDEESVKKSALSAGANRFILKQPSTESFTHLAEEIRSLAGIR